jgi:hypothetical protein
MTVIVAAAHTMNTRQAKNSFRLLIRKLQRIKRKRMGGCGVVEGPASRVSLILILFNYHMIYTNIGEAKGVTAI